jgi:hypothetical protein
LVDTWDITKKNVAEVKGWLTDSKLTCISLIPDLFAKKRCGKGSLSAKDASVRHEALEKRAWSAALPARSGVQSFFAV